ncbi:MAG: hypothetical protein K0V04_37970 [Deltaproteobacteria bacterium]|nr:hypothetical protein [Deltaproteobacteria bacterium]
MKNVIFTILAMGLATQLGCDQETDDLDERVYESIAAENMILVPVAEGESPRGIARVQTESELEPEDGEPLGLAASDDPSEAMCWVTLEWCVDPDNGGVKCTWTPGCTADQIFEHCSALVYQNC